MPTSARQNNPFFGYLRRIRNIFGPKSLEPYSAVFQFPEFRRGGRLCPPAEYTDFTVIFGKFAASQRADVCIGPYTPMGECVRFF